MPAATDLPAFRRIAAIATFAFPILLLAGFLMHPNLLDLSPGKALATWVPEWRGRAMFHWGHLLVMLTPPLIIASVIAQLADLRGRGLRPGFWGAVLAVVGAVFLAADKGALTLTLTAFQEIPDPEFAGLAPALQALLDRSGWLWITWAFALLPLGAALLLWAGLREDRMPGWQGWAGIAGLLLLMNPDIEIISAVGAALMSVAYLPMAARFARGRGGGA